MNPLVRCHEFEVAERSVSDRECAYKVGDIDALQLGMRIEEGLDDFHVERGSERVAGDVESSEIRPAPIPK